VTVRVLASRQRGSSLRLSGVIMLRLPLPAIRVYPTRDDRLHFAAVTWRRGAALLCRDEDLD
jgi:hypothetical protein